MPATERVNVFATTAPAVTEGTLAGIIREPHKDRESAIQHGYLASISVLAEIRPSTPLLYGFHMSP